MSNGEIETLGAALPEEITKVRALLGHYEEIGPAGAFGAHNLKVALERAEKAVMSGDAVAMIRSYKELQNCK